MTSITNKKLAQPLRTAQLEQVSKPVAPQPQPIKLTVVADGFDGVAGAARQPARLDPRRFPNAASPDSMKWVDHGKRDATYDKVAQAFQELALPPGFDAVLLGPSRCWPSPAVEVAVQLPNGTWEQNAFLPENGKLTQLSNLDPSLPGHAERQAQRPPELRGNPLACALPLELSPAEGNAWVVQDESPEGVEELALAAQLLGEASVPEGVSDVQVLGHSSAKVWQDQPEPHFELSFMRDGKREQGAFKFADGEFVQVSKPADGKPAVTLSLPGVEVARAQHEVSLVASEAVEELKKQGLDVELIGPSERKDDGVENIELVVNGKRGTFLNDNGLLVNRADDGQRLNGRSAELNAALDAEHAEKQQAKADAGTARLHEMMGRFKSNRLDLDSLDD
jgi:hypothetical protein